MAVSKMTETENISIWKSCGNLIKKHFIGENVCSPYDFRLSLFAEWSKGKFCLLFLPSPHFYLDRALSLQKDGDDDGNGDGDDDGDDVGDRNGKVEKSF